MIFKYKIIKVFIFKSVRGKSARRTEQFGVMRGRNIIRENEAGVGAKESKPIKTACRCVLDGPINPLLE